MREMKGGSMTGVKSGYTKPVNDVNKVKNWQIWSLKQLTAIYSANVFNEYAQHVCHQAME